MSADGYKILTRSKLGSLEQVAPDLRREIINGINNVEQAFNASNICAVLDVPFALFFVFVLYLLEPAIALVVLAFLVIVFLEVSGERSPLQKIPTSLVLQARRVH